MGVDLPNLMPEVIERQRNCGRCTWDELNEKYAAVCKQRDELAAELRRVTTALDKR